MCFVSGRVWLGSFFRRCQQQEYRFGQRRRCGVIRLHWGLFITRGVIRDGNCQLLNKQAAESRAMLLPELVTKVHSYCTLMQFKTKLRHFSFQFELQKQCRDPASCQSVRCFCPVNYNKKLIFQTDFRIRIKCSVLKMPILLVQYSNMRTVA